MVGGEERAASGFKHSIRCLLLPIMRIRLSSSSEVIPQDVNVLEEGLGRGQGSGKRALT